MKNKKIKQAGFITLFFVLGISFTFLTWISLSSEKVFEYIHIKKDFMIHRDLIKNTILCADSFVNNFIGSRYNLDFIDREYDFYRSLFSSDQYFCQVNSIHVNYKENQLDYIYFILGDFAFEYKFKNGFVDYIKTFNLF